VKAAEEIHKSKLVKDLFQRALDESKHGMQIKSYLLGDKQRLFNSLVIGVYGGAPEWHELNVEKWDQLDLETAPSYFEGVFGVLTLHGNERLFAIDGQHRVVGIRAAVAERRSIGEEEVSAIFVGHKETVAGRQRTRRLFTRLNRFAKPVRKEEIIALDEDDVVAILTRRFVEDNPEFQGKISIRKTKALPASDKQSFTTISALYDCLDSFLKVQRAAWSDFKRLRPTEQEIENFYVRASSLWTALGRTFPPLQEMFNSAAAASIAGIFRHPQGGHMLFRPVGLLLVIDSLARFMMKGTSMTEALGQIANVPMELGDEPWTGLLWDKTNRRMITQPENQKAALKLLYYGAGGDLADLNTNLKDVRMELAGLLNRRISNVKLRVY
jgi:DNA sulfur modification protein DndB